MSGLDCRIQRITNTLFSALAVIKPLATRTFHVEVERESESEAAFIVPELGLSLYRRTDTVTRGIAKREYEVEVFDILGEKFSPASRWEPEDVVWEPLAEGVESLNNACVRLVQIYVGDLISNQLHAEFFVTEFNGGGV